MLRVIYRDWLRSFVRPMKDGPWAERVFLAAAFFAIHTGPLALALWIFVDSAILIWSVLNIAVWGAALVALLTSYFVDAHRRAAERADYRLR